VIAEVKKQHRQSASMHHLVVDSCLLISVISLLITINDQSVSLQCFDNVDLATRRAPDR